MKQYSSLIVNAKADLPNRKGKYIYANHHVFARCQSKAKGRPVDNSSSNLVRLTHQEHYEAHRLLHLIYPKHYGLAEAFIFMRNQSKTNNCASYASAQALSIKASYERAVMKVNNNQHAWQRQDNRDRAIITQELAHTCPHCNKTGKGTIHLRWHFANCLDNPDNEGLTRKQIKHRYIYGYPCKPEAVKQPRNYRLTSGNLLNETVIEYRVIWLLDNNIDSFGWVSKAAKAWCVSHAQVKRFTDKYFWLPVFRKKL